MAKIRIFLFLLTLAVVGVVGYFLTYYAKGYRFDFSTFKFLPNGILVIKSNPDSAQVFINGELTTATNATLSLAPGTYDVAVKKEGFIDWNKRLIVQKEVVTEADAHLFRVVPSLSAITFSGVESPLPSPDFTKIAYIVPSDDINQQGLWIMETVNLPLGFSRDPRMVTDGKLTNAKLTWSPDARQILVEAKEGSFLLDIGSNTPQAKRINIQNQVDLVLKDWGDQNKVRDEAKINSLDPAIADILTRKVDSFVFAPDESKVLYIANGEATIPDEIIKPIPGASTQKQERDTQAGHVYVYDFKEDRNYLVDDDASSLSIKTWTETDTPRHMFWFASSRHLVLAEPDQVSILDLDGTNKRVVYSGSYVSPNALVAPSTDRLLILTNLGANSNPPNIYSLSLK